MTGGPYDPAQIELLASSWRERHRDRLGDGTPSPTAQRAFYDDSYRFARDALDQLKAIDVEMVVTKSTPKREGVWIDGKFCDWEHLPPWYENLRPAIGHQETQDEAEANEILNARGSDRVSAVIWGIAILWLVVAAIFVAVILA